MAEAHPVGFRWVMKARERGAKVIHVDPRFGRTSAMADLHVPIRAGSDIAWLGGLINYVLTTESWFREYVLEYTNAATIINDNYEDAEDLGGLFSGWDPETRTYDATTWMYEGGEVSSPAGRREHTNQAFEDQTGAGMMVGNVREDRTLQDPRCVLNILRRHYARYTPEMVEEICGVPPETLREVADELIRNSGRERTSAFVYAVGWTQHTAGVQMIRAASVLQLLLGNVGRPGGGIMAMRGHASIQGSTDIPTLYDLLPGYLHMPRARGDELDLETYIETGGARRGWWSHFPEYIVSLLKAWFGDAATPENDFGFPYLPKITGNHSHFPTMLRAYDGALDGLLVMGQNPAVGSQHSGLQRRALAHLRWLVVRELSEIETASFWYDSPEVADGELRTEDIQTEVFLMPAASHLEKEGTFTNTQRLLQWRDKALEPPGDARSELWFMHHLYKRVRARYEGSTEDKDWPILNLHWPYAEHGDHAEPSAQDVLREINGYVFETGEPVKGFAQLQDDGSTACGCWIYSGVFADGVNQARRRDPTPTDAPGNAIVPTWGWAWPANRRILYNRASADPEGRPWSERKALIWWDEEQERWTGHDVPDFVVDRPPDYVAPDDAEGMDAISGTDPFMMMADGRGWLFAPAGLLDGPLPTHYEPLESPFHNLLYPDLQENPAALRWDRADNPVAGPGDPRYPCVVTTFRVTEHHTAGGMSRFLPWLDELQPGMFAEIGTALARDRGIGDGEWLTIVTPRAEIEARAIVSDRMRPLHLGGGRLLHQVALPYHWGHHGPDRGDSANDLGALSGDPNVSIQESKAFVCDVRAGRRTREPTERLKGVHEAPQSVAVNRDHPAEVRPHT
jgi:formate dehydrogenase major subunit